MKRRVMSLLAAIILCFSLAGCSKSSSDSSEPKPTAAGLISIPNRDYLYYDPVEKVVYIMYRRSNGYTGYGYMSPYYASNGLPYLYDVNAQTLIKIGG